MHCLREHAFLDRCTRKYCLNLVWRKASLRADNFSILLIKSVKVIFYSLGNIAFCFKQESIELSNGWVLQDIAGQNLVALFSEATCYLYGADTVQPKSEDAHVYSNALRRYVGEIRNDLS